ncbi:MAG: tryptophan 2,3-dioxygenase, partial [Gaiellales bacterium]|nr:tryptophan 2,3-dioxygenase [Gaiellales bacterium]
MLERLSPWEYHELRKALGHGSGFDSPGWKQMRRLAHPLWDAFTALLARHDLELSDVYVREPEHPSVYDLAEALIELDERTSIWRDVHVKMVQRVIGGGAIGTQGTPVAVLAGLTKSRLFPALWDVRNTLTEFADENH